MEPKEALAFFRDATLLDLCSERYKEASAVLRAVVKERDALKARVAIDAETIKLNFETIDKAIAERDALKAEAALAERDCEELDCAPIPSYAQIVAARRAAKEGEP